MKAVGGRSEEVSSQRVKEHRARLGTAGNGERHRRKVQQGAAGCGRETGGGIGGKLGGVRQEIGERHRQPAPAAGTCPRRKSDDPAAEKAAKTWNPG